ALTGGQRLDRVGRAGTDLAHSVHAVVDEAIAVVVLGVAHLFGARDHLALAHELSALALRFARHAAGRVGAAGLVVAGQGILVHLAVAVVVDAVADLGGPRDVAGRIAEDAAAVRLAHQVPFAQAGPLE